MGVRDEVQDLSPNIFKFHLNAPSLSTEDNLPSKLGAGPDGRNL